jgi:hypothetical protein
MARCALTRDYREEDYVSELAYEPHLDVAQHLQNDLSTLIVGKTCLVWHVME